MCSLETEVGEAEAYPLEYKYLYPRRNYMSLHLLSRREGYTRVYTLVYPRVHWSVHACTQPYSKYSLCRGLLCPALGTNTWTSQRCD